MIQVGNISIINGDRLSNQEPIDFTGLYPITCGLSIRSTVTASSMVEDGFTYCLQRSIFDLSGNEISPQEFKVLWKNKTEDVVPYLELITLLLLCNVPTEIISKLRF